MELLGTSPAHARRPRRRRARARRRTRQLGRRRVGRSSSTATVWLTYRVRRPLARRPRRRDRGRRAPTTASRFEPVCEVFRDDFGAESFERPVVLRRPDGGWRLYLSLRDAGLQALVDRGPRRRHAPRTSPRGVRTVVLPGDDEVAVKDPVITVRRRPVGDVAVRAPARPTPATRTGCRTSYLTSDDGLAWTRHGTVLEPTPGSWDARGARVTTVLSHDPLVVLYDGRATAEDNWHETTSVARADATGVLRRRPRRRRSLRSPDSDGALRYATAVPLPGRVDPLLLRAGPARRRARPGHHAQPRADRPLLARRLSNEPPSR